MAEQRSPDQAAATAYRRQAMNLRDAALAGMPLFGSKRHGGIAAVEGLVDLVDALADENERLRREVDTQTARKSEWFDEAARRGQRLTELLDELEALRAVR